MKRTAINLLLLLGLVLLCVSVIHKTRHRSAEPAAAAQVLTARLAPASLPLSPASLQQTLSEATPADMFAGALLLSACFLLVYSRHHSSQRRLPLAVCSSCRTRRFRILPNGP